MLKQNSDLDGFIEELGKMIAEEEASPSVLSVAKYKQVEFVYECMKYLMRGADANVYYSLFEPVKTMASVSVESESIEISDPLWFSRAVSFASNVEVYPLTNGKLRMTFTFHDITKLI